MGRKKASEEACEVAHIADRNSTLEMIRDLRADNKRLREENSAVLKSAREAIASSQRIRQELEEAQTLLMLTSKEARKEKK